MRRSGTHFRSLEEEEVSWKFPTQLRTMWVSFPRRALQSTLLVSLWGGGMRKVGSLRTHRIIKGFPSESWKQYIFWTKWAVTLIAVPLLFNSFLCSNSLNYVHTQAYYLQMYALLTGSCETDVAGKVTESKWSKPSVVGIKCVLWPIICRSFAIILNCSVQCGEMNSVCPLEEQIKTQWPYKETAASQNKRGRMQVIDRWCSHVAAGGYEWVL